jgi:hypothetical protein
MIDPITALSFSVFENKGTYALLLGSGISRSANIPTGWEITLDLIRRVGLVMNAGEQTDWAGWYHKKFDKEPNYSELLATLADTPDQRRAILHGYIEPTQLDLKEGRKVPTKAHKSIAQLVRDGFFRVIITTNFDRLLENSLREVGIEPSIIKSPDDIDGAIPLTHAHCYLIKLHGDYLDTRIKNTEDELSTYSKKVDRILDRILDEFGLIICGWSADWDQALKSAILRTPNRRYSTFWLTRRTPSSAAQDLIAARSARVVEINDADEIFATLQRNVATQTAFGVQDPRSTALLIANAKRFLGRPEDRIQLQDIISREIRHINELLNSNEFDTGGTWSADRFESTVSRYEALMEPATRLFGILGRWGTGNEFDIAIDVIRNLASPELRGGIVALNNLRTYPARLLLFGYGLGLVKADRYLEIFKLFTTMVTRDHRKPVSVVESLVAWDGDERQFWNALREFPEHNRMAPLSDHLYKLFGQWTTDYLLFAKNEFTRLFEGFELLGGLCHIGISHDEASLDQSLERRYEGGHVWAPIGRAIWDVETASQIFEQWRRPEFEAELIQAGFARKSGAYLEKAIKALQNLSARRW